MRPYNYLPRHSSLAFTLLALEMIFVSNQISKTAEKAEAQRRRDLAKPATRALAKRYHLRLNAQVILCAFVSTLAFI
jgi:hypothetical protein